MQLTCANFVFFSAVYFNQFNIQTGLNIMSIVFSQSSCKFHLHCEVKNHYTKVLIYYKFLLIVVFPK